MSLRSSLRDVLRPVLRGRHPRAWQALIAADVAAERLRHSAAGVLPILIQPQPRHLEVAITARCNQRCLGCRYGRDFMPGEQLSLELVRDLLQDAREAGVWDVRFYGGEPLLHPDLPRMIALAHELCLSAYFTTNGTLLDRHAAALKASGLRALTIGYYGTGIAYDAYVQRPNRYRQLKAGVAALRDRFGSDISLSVNWLLTRPSCSVEALQRAWDFCTRQDAILQIDLVHYSLPYFTVGPDRLLQFKPEDRPAVERVVVELLRLKQQHPQRVRPSVAALASIPDWIQLGPAMRVPCDSQQLLWVGADGTVQQCYAAFRFGDLHERRLRELLFTPQHAQHARAACQLDCPNCHCRYPDRIRKHAPSWRRYSEVARRCALTDR